MCTSMECSGPTFVPSLCKQYLEEHKKINLFAHDCIIYWKILNNKDVEKLQTDLHRLEIGRKEIK